MWPYFCLTNLLDAKCSCVFTHLSMLAGYLCVLCIAADWLFCSYVSCLDIRCDGGSLYLSVCWGQTAAEIYLVMVETGAVFLSKEHKAEHYVDKKKELSKIDSCREKQCIRFSKRCRYQHFCIAWPGPAFPLTYLSSQELAPGKKWWKDTQYLNAFQPNKFSLLFGFDMNIEKTPSEA